MCLLIVRHRTLARYPLLIAANRDEFHARPTEPMHHWPDAPHVLAGRDGAGRGTWLGITRSGRWAAITNVRAATGQKAHTRSRGELTASFLKGEIALAEHARAAHAEAELYEGFNLLLGDGTDVVYVSSATEPRTLAPGDYLLSNATLDTPWPKVERLRSRLSNDDVADDEHAILDALRDGTIASDDALPDTGVGITLERFLSPVFIAGDVYGTRSSTILRVDAGRRLHAVERTYGPLGVVGGEQRFALEIEA